MQDEKALRQELVMNLIQLGEMMHLKVRKGEEDNPEIMRISKRICTLENEIHRLGNKEIPGKHEGKCPICLKEYSPGTVFCGECGLNINEYYEKSTEHCPTCNGITMKENHFCGICGSRL